MELIEGYPEIPTEIPPAHLEKFDSHGESQVFSIAHVCESTVTANPPALYAILLKSVSARYDHVSFADLGKKP